MSAEVVEPQTSWRPVAVGGSFVGACVVLVVVVNVLLATSAPSGSPDGWSDVVLGALVVSVLTGAGLFVLRATPRHPIGRLLVGFGVLFALQAVGWEVGLVGMSLPGYEFSGAAGFLVLSDSIDRVLFGMLFLVVLLFPDGRPVSARWRPVVVATCVWFPVWAVVHTLGSAPIEDDPYMGVANPWQVHALDRLTGGPQWLMGAALLGILAFTSFVLRFKRSSARGEERQQLKWVGFAAAGVPVCILALAVASLVGPDAMNVAGDAVFFVGFVGFPLAVVVAVTRYRLYDLDLLVNHTVVYGTVSVGLLGAYGLVAVLVGRVAGAGLGSPWVVAVATLSAALLAAPARARVQQAVDQVFHRRAWAAAQRVDSFTREWREAPVRPAALQQLLADVLGDPDVEVGLWLVGRGYVSLEGRPFVVDPQRAALPLLLHGQPLAVLVHDPALVRDRRLLATVSSAALLLLDNARLQAEVRAQLAEVEASRARLVQAADAERRKVERDLHDGAQQRLVGLALRVKLEGRAAEPAAAKAFAGVAEELELAIRELRELARGIHPAALDEGLRPALESLVIRLPVPVELDLPSVRLPPESERTAYFLACEALTNGVKHARASTIRVRGVVDRFELTLEVSDDGCGGADPAAGLGLIGLQDRLAAVGGYLEIDSPHGGGTTLRATIPCG